ncbi:alanyl-tRNA synthetase [Scopulibacillus darangshiensis]|uniref:Alanine--tRNA ligase n=1 Tax=Scopulibacillus darangshiensis TaxID=442528 RepID=A0A4R2PD08_9BACL|nr:alanine--tRNA ligase [Scopulibacillus darangshiensis]TCP32284.1 alanyl-tRNA synthetase [Scopulibacillus darangshiensis]
MKKLMSADVRQMFLDFFKEKGHRVEPSASLVPVEDPSLLWINSGVATLKKYFDGRVVPENPRIVNAQKAIRTNDIENVGYTARHHTFFEMLGNFSIGDYFKEEAIIWAWEFLTSPEWIGFDQEKLAVTIHPEDDEAYAIWHDKVGLPEDKIIRLEENFWDIGEGPSGPNTEIFYDRGEAFGNDPNDPELFPGGENERHLEIWNLVFSQYNHNPDGSYTPLPKKNIDTGMGLERVVSVIQDAKTNFDTDLFLPIINKIEQISGVKYGVQKEKDTAFKVIADHVRSVSFAVSDGALPSNEGRGYVLRRLIRRAVRFAMELGINKPFMYELVPVVADIMKDFYGEVVEKSAFIQKVIRGEEERFHETIHEGLVILKDVIAKEKANNRQTISGEDVFKLYDTFGFPVELTEEYAQHEGLNIDHEGFEKALDAQRKRARSARQTTDSMQVQNETLREITVPSEFIGYSKNDFPSHIKVIIKGHDIVDFASAGEEVQVILDQTPFYAESGGQIADHGVLENESTALTVKDVQKAPNGQNLHSVMITKGKVKSGDRLAAEVNSGMRRATEKNHTATHLLHQALKDTLGSHVNQAGSLVTPERLRFDFSHFGQVIEDELKEIERSVNERIWEQLAVETMQKPIAEAKAMGAMALFGEKYGDVVRVVKIADYSLELCGGCHVNNTAEIGLFKIVSEAGIGAGTRRIEAVTGQAAYERLNQFAFELQTVAHQLKTNVDQVPARIDALQKQIKDLEKDNASLTAKLGNAEANDLIQTVQEENGVKFIAKRVNVSDMNHLRSMVDQLKNELKSGIIVLAAVNDGKVNLAGGVTKDLISEGYHAGKLIKEVAAACGGGGGGRPDMAQAGGKNPAQVDDALAVVPNWIKSLV